MGTGGCGPWRFGPLPVPLPLTTHSESPCTSSAVGYHCVGIRPMRESTCTSPDSWKTATAFASASATNSRVPSGDSARAFGVLPSRTPPGGGSSSQRITRRARVSTTATRSVLALAAKSRLPSALSASADGWRPTAIDRSAVRCPALSAR